MKSVVFDFGAVLFQWKPLELLQAVVPELAPDDAAARALAAQIFESFTPHSDWALFDLGQVDEPRLAERIAKRLGITEAQVRRVIDAIPPHLEAQAPTVALFHRLRSAGHRMFYLSNMPAPYADSLERNNPFIAQFDDGIFSGRVGLMKPHAEIFQLAQTRFGLVLEQPVFIDDHAGNVSAARALQWQAVHFTGAAGAEQELAGMGWL